MKMSESPVTVNVEISTPEDVEDGVEDDSDTQRQDSSKNECENLNHIDSLESKCCEEINVQSSNNSNIMINNSQIKCCASNNSNDNTNTNNNNNDSNFNNFNCNHKSLLDDEDVQREQSPHLSPSSRVKLPDETKISQEELDEISSFFDSHSSAIERWFKERAPPEVVAKLQSITTDLAGASTSTNRSSPMINYSRASVTSDLFQQWLSSSPVQVSK